MVILMSGYILYYTSNVMPHYRTDQHVAAALALFAAIATLFYYILEIVMRHEPPLRKMRRAAGISRLVRHRFSRR